MQRSNQIMLSFLKLKAIVNGSIIYPLPDSKPVFISVTDDKPRIVITDGFHISKPLTLVFEDADVAGFKVVCVLNDRQCVNCFLFAGLSYRFTFL